MKRALRAPGNPPIELFLKAMEAEWSRLRQSRRVCAQSGDGVLVTSVLAVRKHQSNLWKKVFS